MHFLEIWVIISWQLFVVYMNLYLRYSRPGNFGVQENFADFSIFGKFAKICCTRSRGALGPEKYGCVRPEPQTPYPFPFVLSLVYTNFQGPFHSALLFFVYPFHSWHCEKDTPVGLTHPKRPTHECPPPWADRRVKQRLIFKAIRAGVVDHSLPWIWDHWFLAPLDQEIMSPCTTKVTSFNLNDNKWKDRLTAGAN